MKRLFLAVRDTHMAIDRQPLDCTLDLVKFFWLFDKPEGRFDIVTL